MLPESDWFTMVMHDANWFASHRVAEVRSKRRRFSVSLDSQDHDRLKRVARKQKPSLTLQYVAEYAIKQFLEKAEGPQFQLPLGSPRPRG